MCVCDRHRSQTHTAATLRVVRLLYTYRGPRQTLVIDLSVLDARPAQGAPSKALPAGASSEQSSSVSTPPIPRTLASLGEPHRCPALSSARASGGSAAAAFPPARRLQAPCFHLPTRPALLAHLITFIRTCPFTRAAPHVPPHTCRPTRAAPTRAAPHVPPPHVSAALDQPLRSPMQTFARSPSPPPPSTSPPPSGSPAG